MVTSDQVAPLSVLISSTPPSNPSSKKYLCQKLSCVPGVSMKGGAKSRSSLTSSVVASLTHESDALCAPASGRICQVGLSRPTLLAAVAVVQPAFLSGSSESEKTVTRAQADAVGLGVALGDAVGVADADGVGEAAAHEVRV